MQELNQSASKQIRNLLIVIGSGVIGALLISYLLVTLYSPSGVLRAGDVLLAPEIVPIQRVELLYYKSFKDGWLNVPLKMSGYRNFYETVSDDRSVVEMPAKFTLEAPATVSIWVAPKNGESALFQEVQIEVSGDYYRILLHQDTRVPAWGYFYHPGLFEKVVKEVQ